MIHLITRISFFNFSLLCVSSLTLGASAEQKPAAAGYQLTVSIPEGFEWNQIKRDIASDHNAEIPELRYVILGQKGKELAQAISDSFSVERWQKLQEGGRLSYLNKFFFANTRSQSNRGNQIVACFLGASPDIVSQFFNQDVGANRIKDLSAIEISLSADGLMMGFDVTYDEGPFKGERHFRMEHCSQSGKAALLPENLLKQDDKLVTKYHKEKMNSGRNVATVDQNGQENVRTLPPKSANAADGFKIFDAVSQSSGNSEQNLPTFKIRGDFSTAKNSTDFETRPWKGMNLQDPIEAQKFSVLMLAYFYSGMATQDSRNVNNNFIAANDTQHYWCHMPWLNQGNAQREAIHGMTMERPLQKSDIYPLATRGADWGIGFYNAQGCKTMNEIFGSVEAPKEVPNWSKGVLWEDGTVSVKTLYTTAKFKALKGSFIWQANVAGPNESERSVQDVSMIQIDIAVKDSTLKGVNPAINNWMMTSYYYDADYDMQKHAADLGYASTINPLIEKIPSKMRAILKMRPIGVQTGFGEPSTGQSLIFAGSKTHQEKGRLNGPADNPKSSCMGCHATAGTGMPMAPGLETNEALSGFIKNPKRFMDYSQQLALAKRNFETRSRKSR